MEVELYSFQYLDDGAARDATEWSLYPSSDIYQDIMRVESQRMIARLGDEDIVNVLCGIGTPLEYSSRGRMYCPQWVLDTLGLSGEGDLVRCAWVRCEDLQRATRLVLRPSEEMMAEPRELLEAPFSLLGAVRVGSVLPLPGSFEGGTLTVEICEPADEVFLDGAEVAVEFKEDHLPRASAAPLEESGAVAGAGAASTEDTENTEDGFSSMVPITSLPPLAPTLSQPIQRRGGHPKGFVPFSGTGYSLKG